MTNNSTTALSENAPLERWMDAVVQSLESLTATLGVGAVRFSPVDDSSFDLPGNYIYVFGESHAYRLGVLGETADLTRLVRGMIGAEPEEVLPLEDVWDGVGEIANILVGNVKTMLGSDFPELSIGLPMMTTGAIVYPKPEFGRAVRVQLDDVSLLVLIHAYPLPGEIRKQRELEATIREQEEMMHQSRRLDAIGQLAAGIAHEINTPIQYIGDNAQFLKDSIDGIFQLLGKYEVLRKAAEKADVSQQLIEEIVNAEETLDLGFLSEEIPVSITQSIEGVARVAGIVAAMKAFSHPGREKSPSDINAALQTTITICRNEWKYAADMTVLLDEALPPVTCVVSEINQVFMNVIVNAAHAIAEKNKDTGEKGVIAVETRREGLFAEIRISDTGGGIPSMIREKVFESFFTTKEVGKGTGQGLAISRSVVVKRHNGELFFKSEEGKGTTFFIRLPLDKEYL